MLEAARQAVGSTQDRPLLTAVTVLTSLGEADLNEVGVYASVDEQVDRLAGLSKACGLDGVVCSPQEVTKLRRSQGEEFCLVTPGIRPAGSTVGDQKRIMTPEQAIQSGTSYLVIGRPITQANEPMKALALIEQEITKALK